MHNKIAATGFAAILSLSLGLAACGGNASSTASSAAATSEATSATSEATSATSEATSATSEATSAATSAASTEASLEVPLFWAGESSDGCSILYHEDYETGVLSILIVNPNTGVAISAEGIPAVANDESIELTNTETGEPLKLTARAYDEAANTLTIDVENHGTVTLTAVTESLIEQEVTKALESINLDEVDLEGMAKEFLNNMVDEAPADTAATSATSEATSATSAE